VNLCEDADVEAYKVLALADEIPSPLHQVNNFLPIEKQPEVIHFLLCLGLDVNEKPTCPFVLNNRSEWIEYSPNEPAIYFSNYLTAPIFYEFGAELEIEYIDTIISDYLTCVRNEIDLDCHKKMIDWLYSVADVKTCKYLHDTELFVKHCSNK
jgi:hypothetical protein